MKKLLLGVGLLALGAFLLLRSCAMTDERDSPVQIDAGVYQPYDEANFPRLFAAHGAPAMAGPIQRLRQEAAEKVALSPSCDRVTLSEVSDRPGPLQVFVDCENGGRWRLTQSDLTKAAGPPHERPYGPN